MTEPFLPATLRQKLYEEARRAGSRWMRPGAPVGATLPEWERFMDWCEIRAIQATQTIQDLRKGDKHG